MRALVISGGGSKGAFAGGIAEYLINEEKRDYDLYVGSSTGSLLVSHLALKKIDEIREIYTNVTHRDIFKISPFRVKRHGDQYNISINHFNTFRSFISKRKTFGDSSNLRKLISNCITKDLYKELQASSKEVIFTVSNITKQRVEYKSSKDQAYEDYCDWAWASANLIPFMSLMQKDGFEYADGGFGSHTPIRGAILNGATEVDAIILEPEKKDDNTPFSENPFDSLLSAFGFMMNRISQNDLIIGKLLGSNRKINIRLYFTPGVLIENSLVFKTDEMKKWWKEGFEFAQKNDPICHHLD
ncbi:MAG: patatin-like phospholipase family protein [Flavobacteriales bacterium]|nr:patatin-like phospholipase family protein [Flavobacteriales bacterium]